ncbi:unnamed protein product [Caenorhabditis angaria]|uniref:Sulfotransferase domain-containing protein n=1 Tax=Caenorhabditis angaria TaxID=860376 RepID=A0A9P1IUP8_9PELO|nr:unnamed protein product [Caenorhabditis angaria]
MLEKVFPLLLCTLFCFFYHQKLAKLEENDELLLEFIRPYMGKFPADYLTVPQYNLTACYYRKAMSQMTTNTMCMLYDPQGFLNGNHSFGETWKDERSCDPHDKNGFGSFPEKYHNTSQYTRFVFIRDPFDRFISFYLDKCIRHPQCYGCKSEDMRCVVRRMYESFLQISRGEKELVSKFNNYRFLDIHSTPTSWVCDFFKFRKVYHVMVIGSDSEERKEPISKFGELLKRKNVPKEYISKIVDDLLQSETKHSTHSSQIRKIAVEKVRTDKIIRKYLHQIYFYDYLVFPEFDRSHLDPPFNVKNGPWDEKYRMDYGNIIRIQDNYSKLKN